MTPARLTETNTFWRRLGVVADDPREVGPFFVELAGLPGAGKSTLTAAWLAALTERGARVEYLDAPEGPAPGRVARTLETARLFAGHPRLGLSALRIARIGVPGVGLTAALLRRAALVDACRAARADIAIFDEALLQRLWSVAQGGSEARHGRAVALLPPLVAPHRYALALVEATPAQVAGRLAGRAPPRSRFAGLSAPEVAARLETGPALFEALAGAAPVPCLRLSTTTAPRVALRALLELTVRVAGRLNDLTVVTTTHGSRPPAGFRAP